MQGQPVPFQVDDSPEFVGVSIDVNIRYPVELLEMTSGTAAEPMPLQLRRSTQAAGSTCLGLAKSLPLPSKPQEELPDNEEST